MPADMAYEIFKMSFKSTGPFRGIGELFAFHGLLVCVGFVFLYACKQVIPILWREIIDGRKHRKKIK